MVGLRSVEPVVSCTVGEVPVSRRREKLGPLLKSKPTMRRWYSVGRAEIFGTLP